MSSLLKKSLILPLTYIKLSLNVFPFSHDSRLLKGAHASLNQFLASNSPLKIMKTAFYFTLKAFFRS